MPSSSPVAETFHWPQWLIWFRQFDSYFVLFLAAALCTFIFTPVYIMLAQRAGWVDRPGGRKRHAAATATMGGLVVFAPVFCGALAAMQLDNLVGQMLRENARYLYALMVATAAMMLLGIIDDRHAVAPRYKLMAQSVVAVAAIMTGFHVEAITLPLLDSVLLPAWAGAVLSFVWIVGITNAMNLTDGLDGLAAGIGFLAASINAIVAIWLGNHYMTAVMVLLAGSLLGFLRYNFHPARVFLGDTGSLALGMFLALASLRSAQKAHTAVLILIPLFALGYPIFDTLLAIARRTLRGQSVFSSDREHIHHRLLDRGARPSAAAIQIYVASMLLSLLCIAAATANHFILGIGMAGALFIAVFSARVLGYLEWGGWAARWSGRDETRILYAAANLSRLKMRRTAEPAQLLNAIGVTASELGCREIILERRGLVNTWKRPGCPGSAGSVLAPQLTDTATAFSMTLNGEAVIRFVLEAGVVLDEERSRLLEDLAGELGERLA